MAIKGIFMFKFFNFLSIIYLEIVFIKNANLKFWLCSGGLLVYLCGKLSLLVRASYDINCKLLIEVVMLIVVMA